MVSDRNSVIHGNQIKDRTVTKQELDATSESTGKVATVQSNGSVDWEFIQSLQDYRKLQDNIMINAFRIAVNGSLTQFNMIDGIVDEYEDESGIDTVNSLNEVYNSTADYYAPYAEQVSVSPFCHLKLENNTDNGTGANSFTNIGTPTYTSGKILNAIELDGSTDALNANALESDINSDTTGSIALWVNPDAGANGAVFHLGDSGASAEFYLGVVAGGSIELIIDAGATVDLFYIGGTIPANTWTHIVITQNGSQLRMYVNSEEITPTKSVDTDPGAWFDDVSSDVGRVGCRNYNFLGNTAFFDGQIDDLRYYSAKALTQTEINAIYNSGNGTQDDKPFNAPENMTLISEEFTAEAQPDSGRIVVLEEDDDSIILNTDLKAYASRDGGSSWVEGTLVYEGDYDASKQILVADFDFTASGVGTGTDMEYKLVTDNNKELKLHATSLNWD